MYFLLMMLFVVATKQAIGNNRTDEKCPDGHTPNCPSGSAGGGGWTRFGLNCYKLKTRPSKGWPWLGAENECVTAEGGHLASVHSEEENNFIAEQIKNANASSYYYWIGMHIIRDRSGKLIGSVWSDGTLVDYADPTRPNKGPWMDGEPNSGIANENCVHIWGLVIPERDPESWNDFTCDSSHSELDRHKTTLASFLLAAILIIFVLLLIIIFAAFFLYKMCKHSKGSFGFAFRMFWLCGQNVEEETELDNTLIDIEQLIYTGPNSRVYFASYRHAECAFRQAVVKVPSRDAFQMSAVIEETRIAAQLRHPRVLQHIGFYRDAFGDVRIVSEFMAGGDLHTHLGRRENKLNVGHLFNFISQIAEGMEYLISQRIIHRDLATRNCMLNVDCTAIKIADFGLSRHFNMDSSYASSSPVRLPLRWMPIECFGKDGKILRNCKFNEKTDVWAFGIVVWECFTRGAQPYESEDFTDVVVRLMKWTADDKNVSEECAADGWPLGRPEQCPSILYKNVMLKCWAVQQKNRATFSTLRAKMDEVFDDLITKCPDTLNQNII